MPNAAGTPIRPARRVSNRTQLVLHVKAGGRCEFDGCNRYLLEHDPTGTAGNFAEIAHIYAFAVDGPRGAGPGRPREVDELSNLMLLCQPCHKLVDDNPDRYPVDVLRRFKHEQEERVLLLTAMGPNRRTVALILTARVADQRAELTLDDMQRAAAPRYLSQREVVKIDLNSIADSHGDHYWRIGQEAIDKRVAHVLEKPFESAPAKHLSVFALGPIPLLVYMGTRLSTKVPTAIYQRHRDTEDWTWKEAGDPVSYETRTIRQGTTPDAVALVLSLSGSVLLADLPAEIDETFTVYEITLVDRDPTPLLLNLADDLVRFSAHYASALRAIRAKHPRLEAIHLFPAVPAPVAVSIGRDILPKVDPVLRVYDFDKREGGFAFALEANRR